MDKAQEELNNMLNDLNSVNDDFVNGYFDNDTILENDVNTETIEKEESIKCSSEEILENKDEIKENNFSYSDILNKLDSKEEPIKFDIPEDYVSDELENDLDKTNSYSKSFSYSEILNRLDNKQDIDINNSNEILDLIGNSNTSEEFFDAIEQDDIND